MPMNRLNPVYAAITGGSSTPVPPPFPAPPDPWVRPADWLALPTISPGDQIFAGLFAVFAGNPNYVALVAEGDYTVDWGDGSVEDFAGGETAEHAYDYDTYDVAEATLCSRGYKQAVITVTPQEGSDLTSVGTVPSSGMETQQAWLDWAVNSPALTALTLGYNMNPGVYTDLVEHWLIGENALATTGGEFGYMRGLQSIEIQELNSAVTCGALFEASTALRSVVLPNLPLCTTLAIAFKNCTALEKAVIGDCPLLENGTNVYEGCSALKQAQHGNWGTSVGGPVDFSSMFTGCTAFTHLTQGDIDLANTTLTNLFTGAGSPLYIKFGDFIGDGTLDFNAIGIANPNLIQYIKLGNLPDVTSLAEVCFNLNGLRIFEMGDAPLCASLFHAWQECWALESWTVGDITANLNAEGMLQDTFSLRTATVNMPLCADWNNAFNYSNVETLVLGDVQGNANFSQALTQTNNLRKLTVGNIIGTTFPTALFASAPALQEIVVGDGPDVTDLQQAFQGPNGVRSISMGDFPQVVDFYSLAFDCPALRSFAIGATSAADEFASAFSLNIGRGSLTSVGLFDTSVATAVHEMFKNQAALRELPAFDFGLVGNFTDFVAGCTALSRSQAFGARVTHSYENCNLQVPALVEIFENLGISDGIVLTFSIANGGSGHAPADVVSFGDTTITVDTVDGGGAILTATLTAGGTAKRIGATLAQDGTTGVGIGAQITVLTVTGDQTITVTGNPGTPYLTAAQKAIAEDKGWTVVTS